MGAVADPGFFENLSSRMPMKRRTLKRLMSEKDDLRLLGDGERMRNPELLDGPLLEI